MVLEKTAESPLDCKEIQLVSLKRKQPWIFIGRTNAEAETPVFDHLIKTANSIEKFLMLGKIEVRGGECHWMASPKQWTWAWANFRRWTGTEGPGVLQSMVHLQRVGLDWATEQQQQKRYKLTNIFLLHNHGFLFSRKLAQSGDSWQGHVVKLFVVKGLCIVCPSERGCLLPS